MSWTPVKRALLTGCSLLSEQCCPEIPSQEFIDVLDKPLEAEINAQCSSPQCTMKQLTYLSSAQKRAFDRDNGNKEQVNDWVVLTAHPQAALPYWLVTQTPTVSTTCLLSFTTVRNKSMVNSSKVSSARKTVTALATRATRQSAFVPKASKKRCRAWQRVLILPWLDFCSTLGRSLTTPLCNVWKTSSVADLWSQISASDLPRSTIGTYL